MTQSPGALRPDEDRTWALLVGVMMWLPAELDARLGSMADVSHAEYQVLRWLALCDDRALHMTRLATATNVSPSHLSRIVARLEKRSFVERTPDPDDGRFTLARLTALGARTVSENEAAYGAAVRELVFARLRPDQAADLEDIAERILGNLRPDCVAAHR
jgi:DNA-binding MarR family transcriptional regulator